MLDKDLHFNETDELVSSQYGYIGLLFKDDDQWVMQYDDAYDSRFDVYDFRDSAQDVKDMVINDFKTYLKDKISEYTEMLETFGKDGE